VGPFAAGRWQHQGGQHPEVLVGGEGLARGAREVLATLLHEAAHGLAQARGVQDTSRGGRYHNRRYAVLAGELGWRWPAWMRSAGRPPPCPRPPRRRTRWCWGKLEARLVLWRHREHAGQAASRNLLVCVCGCPRRIRVAPSTLAEAPIVCAACDLPFSQ
jgi:hypothetical protein